MKKIQRILIACAVLLMASINVYAAGTGIFLEKCLLDGSGLRVVCSDIDTDMDIKEDSFYLTLDGTQVPVTAISTVREEKIPMTVYCLVDVSGSMKKDQMQQVKEVLYAVCEGLDDKDNMVISKLGNQTEASGFLSDKEEIKTVIGQLESGNDDTNLYAGIQESIGILNADRQVNPKRCLLILSDGDDDQKSGITREEAERAVKEAHLSVYTVATLPANPSAGSIESGKVLGSFARISAAGIHYVPSVDGISGTDAGRDIVEHIGKGVVLKAELLEPVSDREKLELCMIYTSADDSRWEDTIVVYAKDIYGIREQEGITEGSTGTAVDEGTDESVSESTSERLEDESAPQESASDSVESTDESQSETQSDESNDIWGYITSENRWVWIASGASVFLLAVIVTAAIVRNKKKKAKASSASSSPSSVLPSSSKLAESVSVPLNPQSQKKTYPLSLMAIGYTDIVHRLELPENEEVTIGRNGKADIILDPNDKKLSGAHCAVKWENEKIYIRDLDSMNGTYVNGIPIRQLGRVAVHKGETVTLGSYEYRIG